MNIHEFQAKLILGKYGIPIPKFYVVSSLKEVEELLQKHAINSAVVKVQIHAGGRGKAGGVKLAKSPKEILEYSKELLGKKIINNQTGPTGLVAHQLLISDTINIGKEYYLGIVIDRKEGRRVLIASPEGGMDIEQVAENNPEKVLHLHIPEDGAFKSYHLLRIAKFMGWEGAVAEQGMNLIKNLVKAFIETDASMLEINPLVLTQDQKLLAVDAKFVVDDNALYRQPQIKEYFDPSQMSSQEARAHQSELAYIALEGDIGCMVNGAGLAMATMDIIQHYGGKPANFLDVGGGASSEKIAEGFKIILSDSNVKAILINIFGGIMNCETLAEGIIAAAKETKINVPLIVRMEGTNVERGKQLLSDSLLKNIVIANSLAEAAQKVVQAATSVGS